MKWLKLFEAFLEEPKFYRFSNQNLLGDKDEIELTPKKTSNMWGSYEFNEITKELGFPDREICIHFLDKLAFDPKLKPLYGDYTYQVLVDDNSELGWSFITQINNWWYKSNPYEYAKKTNQIVQELDKSFFGKFHPDKSSEEEAFVATKILMDFGLIGFGKIDDLMNQKLWMKQPVYVYTTDKVKIRRI